MYSIYIHIMFVCFIVRTCNSVILEGPDPWNYETNGLASKLNDMDIPPDLKTPVIKKERVTEVKGFGDWWFKRMLTIVLKSGHVKKNDDGSVAVSLQMRYEEEKWRMLEDYLKSDIAPTDIVFRRSVGYVEEAIYRPTITENIAMAWSDYIQVYFIEYKSHITWMSGILAATGVVIWLWQYISHKHVIVIVFALLYIYEVFISYKEAEQQELEKFLSAVNTCKWYFWTTDCTVPSPDPLIFMKHMNPMKIGIRMFTSLISEPIITLNSTIKLLVLSMTDGLWFPFDKIVYAILIIVINISLIYLLVMIVFNFIFNIPFNLSFLGIISVGVKQRTQTFFSDSTNTNQHNKNADTDRISGDRLDRLLNVFSVALNNAQNASNTNTQSINNSCVPTIRRSASTGRLPNVRSTEDSINKKEELSLYTNLRKRNKASFHLGSGDH